MHWILFKKSMSLESEELPRMPSSNTINAHQATHTSTILFYLTVCLLNIIHLSGKHQMCYSCKLLIELPKSISLHIHCNQWLPSVLWPKNLHNSWQLHFLHLHFSPHILHCLQRNLAPRTCSLGLRHIDLCTSLWVSLVHTIQGCHQYHKWSIDRTIFCNSKSEHRIWIKLGIVTINIDLCLTPH